MRPIQVAFACAALLFALSPPPAAAVQAPPSLDAAASGHAGLAWMVIEPDGRRRSGMRGVDAEGAPFTPDTPVSLYSLTKPMTATLALLLADAGTVDLDRPIGQIAAVPAPWAAATLRQLLGHASGMRHYRDGEWLRLSRSHCARTDDALSAFIADPPAHPPGSQHYSSFGYVLASHVIASAARREFGALIAERIFAPAGMGTRLWSGATAPPPNGVEGRNGRFRPARAIDNSCKYGAGAAIGSAADVARFGEALVRGRLMPVERARSMLESPVAGGSYGLGWGLGHLADGAPFAAHTGSGIGGSSAILVNLATGRVVAVVGNGEQPSLGPLARSLIEHEFGN